MGDRAHLSSVATVPMAVTKRGVGMIRACHPGRRSGFGRWPARCGVEHDQGAVRWLATRAGFGPDRNVHEWPPGLARRGPRTGEVAKAVEPTTQATTYPFSDVRWLIAVCAARAPAGLERGGDRSAGPAGGRAARGERSEPP
jgi:hypothetical protein